MFDFKIVGMGEATTLLNEKWPTKTVSVIQESASFESTGPSHLVIHMSDVDSSTKSLNAPSPSHLKTVLDHTVDLKDGDRLLVNCFAGQSRSTAAAIGILIQHGCDSQTAFDLVLENRGISFPNTLLIKHIDDHFNLGGQLIQIVSKHNAHYTTPRLSAGETIADLRKQLGL